MTDFEQLLVTLLLISWVAIGALMAIANRTAMLAGKDRAELSREQRRRKHYQDLAERLRNG